MNLIASALVKHNMVKPALLVEKEFLHHGHSPPDTHPEVLSVRAPLVGKSRFLFES